MTNMNMSETENASVKESRRTSSKKRKPKAAAVNESMEHKKHGRK